MLLNKNIKIKDRNPLYHFIIGLIFLGMAGWVLVSAKTKAAGITQFDWVYAVVFGMVGAYFVYSGLNIMLRKAYIRVDDEKIAYKPDEQTASQTIYWKDVVQIREVGNNFEMVKKEGATHLIHFSYYDYANADELKNAIRQTASEKGIPINRQGATH